MKKDKTIDTCWKKIHESIFGNYIPESYRWTKLDDIIKILNIIGKFTFSNHMFFPNGGGLDLEGAKKSGEENCIELSAYFDYLVKPKHLAFENIDSEFEWNYFRLETENLEPSGVYKNLSKEFYTENVLEVKPLQYIDLCYLETNEYNGKKIPKNARQVIRVLRGSILIFKKSSIYNSIPQTYSGIHDRFDEHEFRHFIEEGYKYFSSKK
jgi:serine/threonine-protein kinase